MGILDFLRVPNMDQGVVEYKNTEGAVLLDVRTPQEYKEGYVPSSKNVPLQSLGQLERIVTDKKKPLFVYFYSGSRSSQAVRMLGKMGYSNVKNIGGIASYTGKVER